ncbi:MAG: S-methyl-5'-thioadenosine phosphorylase [Euryarchaeota archaeon]|nr:S-methyl-5'-thioadenosine phosphorylase [Euryarchaeota archaeon]
MAVKVGIIGGSGLYDPGFLEGPRAAKVNTPWGFPSDKITVGRLGDREVAFLPRHGAGHKIPPHRLNSRANIYALKRLGATHVISASAVGSLQEDLRPLDVVIPDQLYDRTRGRDSTFFDEMTAHVKFSAPFCPHLSGILAGVAREKGYRHHPRGTYVCIQGPQFSTRAESQEYRRAGFDVIGMTALPEARLAREAELCYATLATVTDYDVWKEEEVDVARILDNLKKNVAAVRDILANAIPRIPEARDCECARALEGAIVTDPKRIGPGLRKDLDLLIGKYLK